MSRLLAFDTSTDTLSLALVVGERHWCREAPGGAQASAALIPQLLALLAEADCPLDSLDAIGFGRGPGAFTGLRTACSVAQGLAFGANKPVLPLDSLWLVAEQALPVLPASDLAAGLDLWVVMDARMDELYATALRRTPAGWETRVQAALWTLPALNAQWQQMPATDRPMWVTGSALPVFGERLAWNSLAGGQARRLDLPANDAQGRPARAAALAQLAEQAWAAGAAVVADQALPVYLRNKVAQTTAEREALRAQPAATPATLAIPGAV